MAYIYNEDEIDGEKSTCGGINAYKDEIPMIGIDFVQGPKVVKVFKRDADGNFMYDADGKKILIDPEPFTGEVGYFGHRTDVIIYELLRSILLCF
jgi:hypothetical protein